MNEVVFLPLKRTASRINGLRALYEARAKSADGNGGLAWPDLKATGMTRFDLALLIEAGWIEPWPIALSDCYRISALGAAYLESTEEETIHA